MSELTKQDLIDHEKHDDERFSAMTAKIDTLATKDDVQAVVDTLKPIAEAWITVKNGRTGIIWIASTIVAVGGAVMIIKGWFSK